MWRASGRMSCCASCLWVAIDCGSAGWCRLTAGESTWRSQYGDSYVRVRRAMNGMLSVNVMYQMRSEQWQQFTHDVVKAFEHPVFNGLHRVRDPLQVCHISLNSTTASVMSWRGTLSIVTASNGVYVIFLGAKWNESGYVIHSPAMLIVLSITVLLSLTSITAFCDMILLRQVHHDAAYLYDAICILAKLHSSSTNNSGRHLCSKIDNIIFTGSTHCLLLGYVMSHW